MIIIKKRLNDHIGNYQPQSVTVEHALDMLVAFSCDHSRSSLLLKLHAGDMICTNIYSFQRQEDVELINRDAEKRAHTAVESLTDLDAKRLDADDVVAFVNRFNAEHRTNQQNIMRLFVAVVDKMATMQKSQYDERNKDTVLLCQKIVNGVEDWKYIRNLRYI